MVRWFGRECRPHLHQPHAVYGYCCGQSYACVFEVIAVTFYSVIKCCAGPQGDNELPLAVEKLLRKLWIL